MKPKTPIRFTQIILAGMLVLAVLSFISVYVTKNRIARSLFSYRAQKRVFLIESFFNPLLTNLEILNQWASQGSIDLDDVDRTAEIVGPLVEFGSSIIERVIVADSENHFFVYSKDKGIVTQNSAEMAGYNPSEQDWFIQAIKKIGKESPYWLHVYEKNFNGKKTFTIARAFQEADGDTGVAAVNVDYGKYKNFINRLSFGLDSRIILIEGPHLFELELEAESSEMITPLSKEDPFIAKCLEKLSKHEDNKIASIIHNESKWLTVKARGFVDTKLYQLKSLEIMIIAHENEILLHSKLMVAQITVGLIAFVVFASATMMIVLRRVKRQHFALIEKNTFVNKSEEALKKLIEKGESERLEFKSTLRWNLHANKPGKEIENAVLKTIVAYLNSEGGTLMIGVDDNGTITGIEADHFPNDDKFLLHFNNLIKERIGLEFSQFIDFGIKEIDAKKVMVVDCRKADKSVFLKHDGEEEFYIRVGPGSRKLPTSKAIEFISKRKKAGNI